MNPPGAASALYLLLTAGGVHYAMRAMGIRRLVPYVKLHAPPSHAPREFVGWLNWQGELIPVVDGTLRLAGRPTEPTLISRILLVQNESAPGDTRGAFTGNTAAGGAHTIGIIAECAHKTARLFPQDFKVGIGAAYAAAAAASAAATQLAHAQVASSGATSKAFSLQGASADEVEIPLLPVMEHEGELLHLLELKHLLTPELCQAFLSSALPGSSSSGAPQLHNHGHGHGVQDSRLRLPRREALA